MYSRCFQVLWNHSQLYPVSTFVSADSWNNSTTAMKIASYVRSNGISESMLPCACLFPGSTIKESHHNCYDSQKASTYPQWMAWVFFCCGFLIGFVWNVGWRLEELFYFSRRFRSNNQSFAEGDMREDTEIPICFNWIEVVNLTLKPKRFVLMIFPCLPLQKFMLKSDLPWGDSQWVMQGSLLWCHCIWAFLSLQSCFQSKKRLILCRNVAWILTFVFSRWFAQDGQNGRASKMIDPRNLLWK